MLGQRSWGPRFSRVHPAERSTRLGRWTAGAIPGGSLAHCSSSCEANTGSPSPRGRGVPSVGNCVGPSGGPGSWPRRLGCGQLMKKVEEMDEVVMAEIQKSQGEYKPLAKVEELEEANYNMIDNVLNNMPPKKEPYLEYFAAECDEFHDMGG